MSGFCKIHKAVYGFEFFHLIIIIIIIIIFILKILKWKDTFLMRNETCYSWWVQWPAQIAFIFWAKTDLSLSSTKGELGNLALFELPAFLWGTFIKIKLWPQAGFDPPSAQTDIYWMKYLTNKQTKPPKLDNWNVIRF